MSSDGMYARNAGRLYLLLRGQMFGGPAAGPEGAGADGRLGLSVHLGCRDGRADHRLVARQRLNAACRVRKRARRARPARTDDRPPGRALARRDLVCDPADAGAGRVGRATPPGRPRGDDPVDHREHEHPDDPEAPQRFVAAAEGVRRAEVRLGWLQALNRQGSGGLAKLGPIAVVVAAAFAGTNHVGTLISLYLLAQRSVLGLRRPGRPQPRDAERQRGRRPLLRSDRRGSRQDAQHPAARGRGLAGRRRTYDDGDETEDEQTSPPERGDAAGPQNRVTTLRSRARRV